MACNCIYFLEPYTIFFFSVFRITYNKFMFFSFFHKYSLNCMALFFLSLLMIFSHKYSLKCTALFLDIHVVFIDNFIS